MKGRGADEEGLKLGDIKITMHLFKMLAANNPWLFGLILIKKFELLCN